MGAMTTTMLLVRVVVSLAVVVGLMVLATRLARRGPVSLGRRAAGPAPLEVVARRGVSRHGAVAVVRVTDRHLVLGVTDAAISLLGEIEGASLDAPAQSGDPSGTTGPGAGHGPGSTWKALLDQMRERTVRRG